MLVHSESRESPSRDRNPAHTQNHDRDAMPVQAERVCVSERLRCEPATAASTFGKAQGFEKAHKKAWRGRRQRSPQLNMIA